MSFSRRAFVAAGPGLVLSRSATALPKTPPRPGPVCFFSKHLPKLPPARLAEAVKSMGFDGVDLTARPKGHVEPARAESELPAAVEAIRAQGLSVPLVTTGLLSANDPTAKPLLTAAGKAGVTFFKPGYHKYAFVDLRRELRDAGTALKGLAQLGRRAGVQLAYHNHASYMGGPVWDIASVMETLDPRWAGFYFDVRHARAEGGVGGWKIASHLAGPRTKVVAVKDFYWEKGPKGWVQRNCPLGEGMVDILGTLAILAGSGFSGPLSVHVEYDVASESQAEEAAMLAAASKDLKFLRSKLQEVYGAV